VENLSFAYPEGGRVFEGVSFTIMRGERVALLGPNGAGKSTLLWCLVGLLRTTSRVTVDGLVLGRRELAGIRRRLGLAFAEPEDQLFMPTVGRDLMFGLLAAGDSPAIAEAKARQAAGRVGLDDRLLARAPHELSSGERRRAALASVLALDPVILALDEPTNSLDAPGRAALAQTLIGLECAQLIATHDLAFAGAVCSRALVLSGGALVADTALSHLLCDREMLERHGLVARVGGAHEQAIIL
jgi:cobalt/nickel transport system ATP-binding protein